MASFLTHSRRPRLFALTAAALIALLLSACMSHEQTVTQDYMNWSRGTNGRATLPTHDALNAKAQSWAEHMARTGTLGHSRLTAGLPSCWTGVGENVGFGSSALAVQNGYMNSSGHRANVLGSWDFVGVGYARSGSRVYTVQVFMNGCR